MRLDQLLMNEYGIKSRSKAKQLILQGKVKVGDVVLTKSSYLVKKQEIAHIIIEKDAYVSFGSQKLLKAFESFPNFDVKNKIGLDIGASNGGFTQVLLEKGALKVYAIDVGKNQLDTRLKEDKRVVCLEETNIKKVEWEIFSKGSPQFFTADLSFISLRFIFEKIKNWNLEMGIVLIKPQFEVGDQIKKFDGIVKEPQYWNLAINKVKEFAKENQFIIEDVVESPSLHAKKNKEFLALVKRVKE
jgi:23S rRNA (cytidine1920-2'-O)/16S rRNA (cytidine1409-2'-O)-methyltransferase